jgi:hypothetical protein
MIDFNTKLDICVCNARTGGDEQVLYREENEEREISLYKEVDNGKDIP